MFSRPSRAAGAPKQSYVSRLSAGRNLRSFVMLFAFLTAIYSFFSAIGNFRSISTDRSDLQSKLSTVSLVLGILFISVFAFQAFGIVATITQRLQRVRIYAFLSFATVLILTGGGILDVVVLYTMKSNIISECEQLLNGDNLVFYPFGFFGPVSHSVVNQQEATEWCTDQWNHDSWAGIIALLLWIFVSAAFSVFSYAYYRQLLDPTSAANVVRAPVRGATAGFPSHYNPAYDASVPSLGYQYGPGQQSYAPPPGPPPFMGVSDGKPPGYAGYGYEVDDKAKENPFADFDKPVRKASGSQEEHDVAGRPAPGGRDTFV